MISKVHTPDAILSQEVLQAHHAAARYPPRALVDLLPLKVVNQLACLEDLIFAHGLDGGEATSAAVDNLKAYQDALANADTTTKPGPAMNRPAKPVEELLEHRSENDLLELVPQEVLHNIIDLDACVRRHGLDGGEATSAAIDELQDYRALLESVR